MSRRRLIVFGGLLMVVGIACWFFPLFHVRPLGGGTAETGKESATPRISRPVDPAVYARDLWDGPWRTANGGTEITRLWDTFDTDASHARKQYGRQAGLGGAWYFRVRGRGTVETVEKNRVALRVADRPRRACLELGLVVDNTVREAVGVKASEFANSQDFNAVSSALNRRVELEVIAPARPLLKPGVVVDFVGCAKIGREADLDPLCLIPIRVKIRGDEKDRADSTDAFRGGTSP